MCARILAAVRAESSPLNAAKLAGTPRTALPPRYATVATVCRNNARFSSISDLRSMSLPDPRLRSRGKLLQMMIHVAVDQNAPSALRQSTERRVVRPRIGRACSCRAVEQCLNVGDVAGPLARLARQQFRRGRRSLGERGNVNDQLFQGWIADR